MHKHITHLHERPFQLVRSGQKTIESRLNDEKRRGFGVGDRLQFINRGDESVIEVEITKLHTYETFAQLFAAHDARKFGEESIEILLQTIEQFYTKTEEGQWGVVGIEFGLV